MKSAQHHPKESERLNSLEQHNLLDTLPEDVYNDVARLASEISGTPVALLNIIGENRQWTKANYGMEVGDVPREQSFCAHTILLETDEVLIVPDTRYDERFHDNPMSIGKPPVIFYAGVPVRDANGLPLGSLCIVDHRPRELSEDKVEALKALAKLVNAHFELRKTKQELTTGQARLQEAKHLSAQLVNELQMIGTETGTLPTQLIHAQQTAQALHNALQL